MDPFDQLVRVALAELDHAYTELCELPEFGASLDPKELDPEQKYGFLYAAAKRANVLAAETSRSAEVDAASGILMGLLDKLGRKIFAQAHSLIQDLISNENGFAQTLNLKLYSAAYLADFLTQEPPDFSLVLDAIYPTVEKRPRISPAPEGFRVFSMPAGARLEIPQSSEASPPELTTEEIRFLRDQYFELWQRRDKEEKKNSWSRLSKS